jgi:hypothetical protein
VSCQHDFILPFSPILNITLHSTASNSPYGDLANIHSFQQHSLQYTRRFGSMFTPPPSPLPPRTFQTSSSEPKNLPMTDVSCTRSTPVHSSRSRRKYTLTLRWTIILIPIILIAITVTTRVVAHPMVFDAFSPSLTLGWKSWSKSLTDWSLHERHKVPKSPLQPMVLSDRSSSPLIKRSTPSATPAPTVPANPSLPTPFPQPYDTTLSSNFSTISCYNFFLNMTQTDALRSCRPFSLLLTHSQAFTEVCFS